MDEYEVDAHMRELTPHQVKILEALYDVGDVWLTRAQIAKAIDKKRLTPYDIEILQKLTERGLLETSTQPTNAPGSDFAYIYRMSDDVAESIQKWTIVRDSIQEQEQEKKRRPPLNLVDREDN